MRRHLKGSRRLEQVMKKFFDNDSITLDNETELKSIIVNISSDTILDALIESLDLEAIIGDNDQIIVRLTNKEIKIRPKTVTISDGYEVIA